MKGKTLMAKKKVTKKKVAKKKPAREASRKSAPTRKKKAPRVSPPDSPELNDSHSASATTKEPTLASAPVVSQPTGQDIESLLTRLLTSGPRPQEVLRTAIELNFPGFSDTVMLLYSQIFNQAIISPTASPFRILMSEGSILLDRNSPAEVSVASDAALPAPRIAREMDMDAMAFSLAEATPADNQTIVKRVVDDLFAANGSPILISKVRDVVVADRDYGGDDGEFFRILIDLIDAGEFRVVGSTLARP